jgi:putative ABC transport system permease protein
VNLWKQVGWILKANARALRRRYAPPIVVIVGIAGVVAVLVAVLSMAAGLLRTAHHSGRPDRIIAVRAGSSTEGTSALPHDYAAKILDAPGVKHDASGRAIASAEILVSANVQSARDGTEGYVPVRGVGAMSAQLRPEVTIVKGRAFRSGAREVIVGRNAARLYRNLEVGGSVSLAGAPWRVVGVFSADGGALESQMLTDADTLMSFHNQIDYQSVTFLLDRPDSIATVRRALIDDAGLSLELVTEDALVARESGTLNTVIEVIAYIVGGIMAFGAVFAALTTMYSAIATRSTEIATLRAMGYSPDAMIIAIVIETLVLALLGGLLGGALAWLVFSGYAVNTLGGAGQRLAFELSVDSHTIAIGVIWASVIGLLGGLPPALQAARMPVANAMRSI